MRAPMTHSLRRLLELALATMPMTFVASCAPETAPGQLPETIQSPGNKSGSDALRTTLIASTQRDASEAYAVQSWGSFVRMENPAQKFVATIDSEGLSVMPDEDDWQLTMRTVAMGCSGAMVYVADALPETRENRVDLRRKGLEEWYLHGPLGVEHGFVVPEPFACGGLKTIALTFDADLTATLDDPDGDG